MIISFKNQKYKIIFDHCTCYIITALSAQHWVHQPLDYEALTNQGEAPVSVYIDHVALQLNLSHYSNEHRIPNVLRARNTTPLCYLSDTNRLKSLLLNNNIKTLINIKNYFN